MAENEVAQPELVCKHEGDIAVMISQVAEMHKIVCGNGAPGLKTKSAVQASKIRIAYLWLGGLTTWFFAKMW